MTAPIIRIYVDECPLVALPAPKGIGRSVITPMTEFERIMGQGRGATSAGLAPNGSLAMVIRVEDADGRIGAGPAGFGHAAVPAIVDQLGRLVLGRSPDEVAAIWEELYRSTLNVGRRGVVLHAISGLDIAMWDLLGRQLDQPVYNLLGGKVRNAQPAYASWLYATESLDDLAAEARGWAQSGFSAVKQRLAYGPMDGRAGIRKNVELVRTVVDAVGPDVDVMADAYMGWTPDYAVRCIRAIEDAGLRLRWLEEPVGPDDIRGLARIRAAVNTPIASGEHEATRHGFRALVEEGAVDVLQPDAMRLGGITEARRVWMLGETFGLEVVAHLGCGANLHLSISSTASSLAEYMPPPTSGLPDEDQIFRELFPEPAPVDGMLVPADGPGLGVTLRRDGLRQVRVIDLKAPSTGRAVQQ